MLFHQVFGKTSQPRINWHATLQSTDYTMVYRVTNNKGSHAPYRATVYVKSRLLKEKWQCLVLRSLEQILAATAQTHCLGRRGQKAPLLPSTRNGRDCAEQAGWGSSAPWREQNKAKPGGTPLFLHMGGEHILGTFRCRTASVPHRGSAPPTLSPLPKEPCSPLLHTLRGKWFHPRSKTAVPWQSSHS